MSLKPWIEHCKKSGTYTVRWRNDAGKKCRDKFTWDNKTDAKLRQEEVERQFRNNALGIYKEITFSEAKEIFLRIHGPRYLTDASLAGETNKLKMLERRFGKQKLNRITYQDVVAYWNEWLDAGKKASTAYRHIMLLHNVFERFKFWNGMVPEVMPEKVLLPEVNPVGVAKEYLGKRRLSISHYGRKRRVSEEELRTAKAWCVKNDPELWEAMKLAIWTALRKSDIKKLKSGYAIDLVQEKTGNAQVMPITLRDVPNFGNLRIRWDYLRGVMGWLKKGTSMHTTWHDLRHCAPSMLADEGFSGQVISQYLGHTNEKMSSKYTHPSGSALIPAVKFLEGKLEAL